MLNARIVGTGSYLPEKVMTNFDLYNIPGIRDNFDVEKARNSIASKSDIDATKLSDAEIFNLWAIQVSGVEQGYYAAENESADDMEVKAARACLQGKEKPEWIITTTFTSEYTREFKRIPNSGLCLAHLLGNDQVAAFSMNAKEGIADLVAHSFVCAGIYKKVLVVEKYDSETSIKIMNKENMLIARKKATNLEEIANETKRILENMRTLSSDLDLVILSIVQDENAGSHVAKNLGIDAKTLSLNTACSGFPYAAGVIYALFNSGNANDALVVSTEKLSASTNFFDPKTAILFRDGAGAVRFRATDKTIGITSPPFLASDYSDYIEFEEGENNKIKMPGGPKVLVRAIRSMDYATHMALLYEELGKEEVDKNTEKLLGDEGLRKTLIKKIKLLVPHDANARIVAGTGVSLGIPEEKVYTQINLHGNISGATVPKNLDLAIREGRIKENDCVVIPAFGGGSTLGAFVYRA